MWYMFIYIYIYYMFGSKTERLLFKNYFDNEECLSSLNQTAGVSIIVITCHFVFLKVYFIHVFVVYIFVNKYEYMFL